MHEGRKRWEKEMTQPDFYEAIITIAVRILLQSGLTLNHSYLSAVPFPPLPLSWT